MWLLPLWKGEEMQLHLHFYKHSLILLSQHSPEEPKFHQHNKQQLQLQPWQSPSSKLLQPCYIFQNSTVHVAEVSFLFWKPNKIKLQFNKSSTWKTKLWCFQQVCNPNSKQTEVSSFYFHTWESKTHKDLLQKMRKKRDLRIYQLVLPQIAKNFLNTEH